MKESESLNNFIVTLRDEITKLINQFIVELEYILKRKETEGEKNERDLKMLKEMSGEKRGEKEREEEKEKDNFVEGLVMGHIRFYDFENCLVTEFWENKRESLFFVFVFLLFLFVLFY